MMLAYRSFTESAPDEVSSSLLFWSVPAHPMFPAELHGKPVLITAGMLLWRCGEGRAGATAAPRVRHPDSGSERPDALHGATDRLRSVLRERRHYYFKSMYFDDLSDAAIDAMIALAATRPSPTALMALWHLGGAMGRVPEDATAFGNRGAEFMFSFDTAWNDPADSDRCIAWSRQSWESLRHTEHRRPLSQLSAASERKRTRCSELATARTTTGWSSSRPTTIPAISSGSTRTSRRSADGTRHRRNFKRIGDADRLRELVLWGKSDWIGGVPPNLDGDALDGAFPEGDRAGVFEQVLPELGAGEDVFVGGEKVEDGAGADQHQLALCPADGDIEPAGIEQEPAVGQ